VRALDNPVTRRLGSRSYSISLVPLPLMAWLLRRLEGGRRIGVLACGAAALALAERTYRCVERPFKPPPRARSGRRRACRG